MTPRSHHNPDLPNMDLHSDNLFCRLSAITERRGESQFESLIPKLKKIIKEKKKAGVKVERIML